MQGTYEDEDSRYVLWNFENVLPGKSGTVEFRDGRAMRGLNRTRWVIAFVVGFIDTLLTVVRTSLSLFLCLDFVAPVKANIPDNLPRCREHTGERRAIL